MDKVDAARVLMADSLGFHIIFALLGVGLPLVISLVEFWAIRRKDENLREAARKLSFISIILVIAGVVSGTIIAIQMSLMWSGLVNFGGPILGVAFMLEGYAFLLEAIFLAIYVGTWEKLRGYRHWVLGLPVILGALLSAVFITSANSWMQNPGGFDLVDGRIVNPNIIEGLMTKTTFFMTTHSIIGYYIATLLVVAGGYCWYIWRKKPKGQQLKTAKFITNRLMGLALVFSIVVAVLGHFSLQHIAETQPRKFAAIELVPQTTDHAPYVVGGKLSSDGSQVEGGIKIPNLLSVLAGNKSSTTVTGLNEFPRKEWPKLVINRLFELKMLLVGIMVAIPTLFVLLDKKWKEKAYSKPMLVAIIASGPLAIIIIELGWVIAEFGRQPYAVNGYLFTKDAFSNNPGVTQWGFIFPSLYVVLFVVTTISLRLYLKRSGAKDKP